MGTTASLPEEVVANSVAPYCFRKRNDLLSLRATCKRGADLARRDLIDIIKSRGTKPYFNDSHDPKCIFES